uniref:Uncharacterized protein n=1 Tax=Gossypium raimondii TaxID=29730 RepID=A0A0D2VDL1_GOSRA|nr:hypothetical protein B456_013G140500 [Gossypium raimondii]KJB81350.1 hypothetical protein B456_013G140500 [Gossypium raimondii]KJB81351.1 hypothetical protein B456_013G140500 [Gossypium raimondii]
MVIQPRWNKLFFSFSIFSPHLFETLFSQPDSPSHQASFVALPLATFVLPLFHVSRLKLLVPSFLHSFFFFFSLSLLNHVSRYYFKAISSS